MKIRIATKIASLLLVTLCAFTGAAGLAVAQASNPPKSTAPVILNREQASAILPPSVFYRGQSASIQGRNSGGIKLPDGKLVLFTMVDTSGYSTSVQETYQAYLLTEVPLTIGGESLKPGAYGFGFIADNKFVVMDIGSNELLRGSTTRDESLKRPTPLQVLADTSDSSYRLYLGRSYVSFSPAAR
jgi:hypothetical protein